jgi:alkylation response protein AidB-like acyl-CoA dehydrogenase
MQYEFTEEENSIRQTATQFAQEMASRQTWDAEAPGAFDVADFRAMGELGFFALALPERLGGLDLGHAAQGLVLEAAGHSLLQGPLLDHCAAISILALGADYESLIPDLVAGDKLATVVFGWRKKGEATLNVQVTGEASGFEIAGYVDVADYLVALATGPDGGLQMVVGNTESVRADPAEDEDYSWRGSGVAEVAPAPEFSWTAVEHSDATQMLSLACSFAAAYSVGCAQRLLDDTVTYVKDRHQFGRPIGSFQAIKHRVADLYIEIEHTRSLVYGALGHAPRGTLLGFMAKRSAASTLSSASRIALQSHGGIGFTWESSLHHYVRAGLRLNGWPLDKARIEDLIYDLAVDETEPSEK